MTFILVHVCKQVDQSVDQIKAISLIIYKVSGNFSSNKALFRMRFECVIFLYFMESYQTIRSDHKMTQIIICDLHQNKKHTIF